MPQILDTVERRWHQQSPQLEPDLTNFQKLRTAATQAKHLIMVGRRFHQKTHRMNEGLTIPFYRLPFLSAHPWGKFWYVTCRTGWQ